MYKAIIYISGMPQVTVEAETAADAVKEAAGYIEVIPDQAYAEIEVKEIVGRFGE